jgi:hypothetical protein
MEELIQWPPMTCRTTTAALQWYLDTLYSFPSCLEISCTQSSPWVAILYTCQGGHARIELQGPLHVPLMVKLVQPLGQLCGRGLSHAPARPPTSQLLKQGPEVMLGVRLQVSYLTVSMLRSLMRSFMEAVECCGTRPSVGGSADIVKVVHFETWKNHLGAILHNFEGLQEALKIEQVMVA